MAGSSPVPVVRRMLAAPGVRRGPAAFVPADTLRPIREAGWPPASRLLEPMEPVPPAFLSRPCEWTAEQLRDAALHVLRVQAAALHGGGTLSRVCAEAVQFLGSRPVWTDPTAFAAHDGGPWTAYADFSRAFLSPLLAAARGLPRGEEVLTLREASRRLPLSSYFQPGALRHIHVPAWLGSWAGGSRTAEQAVASLWGAVESLDLRPRWAPWQTSECGREDGLLRILLKEAVRCRPPQLVYVFGDGGGNCARTIVAEGIDCVSFDADSRKVAACYLHERAAGGSRLLPLVGSLAAAAGLAPGAPRGGLAVVLSRGLEPLLPLGLLPEAAAALLLRLGERVLLEFDPRAAKADLATLLAAFRPWFRPDEVAPISTAGRCLCSLVPA